MPIAEDPEPRPMDEPADDPFANLVLDEEFVKGATVKEASGRSRMLSARWKRQPPPEPEGWRPVTEIRRGRFGRRAKPVGSRPVGLGWLRRLRTPVLVLMVVSVVLGLMQMGHGFRPHTSAPVPTVGPETARPTAAPPTTDPDTPTVDHPWAGSPAEAWPEGADALVVPPATAIGTFSQDEVAADLQHVKDFLVAANLDPKTVAGGTPQAALDLLNKSSRSWAEGALAKPTKDHDPTSWFSRFDPRLAIPVTDKVKVQGRMSFESDGENGLLVHTDVTFVYALKPGPDLGKATTSSNPSDGAKPVNWLTASGTNAMVQREIVRRVQDFRMADPAHYQVDPAKLTPVNADSSMGNNVCDMGSGYLQPSFPTSAPGTEGPRNGRTSDPYDRSKPLPEQDGSCGTISRS